MFDDPQPIAKFALPDDYRCGRNGNLVERCFKRYRLSVDALHSGFERCGASVEPLHNGFKRGRALVSALQGRLDRRGASVNPLQRFHDLPLSFIGYRQTVLFPLF